MTAARYALLKRDVQRLTTRAARFTDQAKVEAFWQLGERIAREKVGLQHGQHNAMLRDLSADTDTPVRNLRYALAFHHHYKRVPRLPLSWGHYRILLDRRDDASRAHYQALAVDQSLAVHQLAHHITADARLARGEPALMRPSDPGYLYKAKVDQVIDGDTIDLSIDLGFHVDRRGRFRLAGINAPELDNPRRTGSTPGRAARDFVFNELATAKTITVKTEKHPDLHGRYVAHLFYAEDDVPIEQCFRDGKYLNAELVEAGHAELVAG